MSSWREERRADRAAEALIAREDQQAAAQAQATLIAAQANAALTSAAAREEHDRKARQARTARRQARRERRHRALARLRRWASASVVDLLIYPLAAVSAAMAIPAMADYGMSLYGPATGWLLAGISELGMWAFASAVQVSRHRSPDRPVWALQLGVVVFAAAAMALNFVHGVNLTGPHGKPVGGLSTGAVMAIVSVAGVIAHQLAVTGARRSRAEREAARLVRRQRRRTATVAHLAVRGAVAEVGADGTVALVYAAGRVVPVRRWGGLGPVALRPAVVPGLAPTTGAGLVPGTTDDDPDSIAAEAAAWLSGPEASQWAAETARETGKRPGTGQTRPARPGTNPAPTGSGTTDETSDGTGDRIAALLAQIRAAIAAGTLPAHPSRRAIQRALRVRAETASAVKHALNDNPEDPGSAGQPAHT